MRFYLGTHDVTWLGKTDEPLFISRTRLERRRTLPRALGPWALDSGGFTELNRPPHSWTMPPDEYAGVVQRLADGIGGMAWAAPQDWMCEPWIVDKTGLSVREHQERTVQNFVDLHRLASRFEDCHGCDGSGVDPVMPWEPCTVCTGERMLRRSLFVPVLQGWTLDDYERCLGLYEEAGVDLSAERFVGLGTVCRRHDTAEVATIVGELAGAGLRLHGFGVKSRGVSRVSHLLASADSLAWSSRARNAWHHDRVQLCGGVGQHRGGCQNCLAWALRWRERVVDGLGLFASA